MGAGVSTKNLEGRGKIISPHTLAHLLKFLSISVYILQYTKFITIVVYIYNSIYNIIYYIFIVHASRFLNDRVHDQKIRDTHQ